MAKASDERLTGVTGISPAAILQKKQSVIGPSDSCRVHYRRRDDRSSLEPQRMGAQPCRMITRRDGCLTLRRGQAAFRTHEHDDRIALERRGRRLARGIREPL